MKFKVGLITLLVAGLMLGLAGSAFAVVTVTDKDGTTDATPGATNVVLQAFTISSNAAGDTVDKFNVTLQTAANELSFEKLTLYLDVDKNGTLGFNDTVIAGATKSSSGGFPELNGGAGVVLAPTTALSAPNTAVAADMTWLLLVATCKTSGLVDQSAVDASIDAYDVVAAGYIGTVNTTTSKVVEITATHLRWTNAGTAFLTQTANNTNIVQNTVTPILTAVDNFGNTDVDFSETIFVAASDMLSGTDLSASLTATGDGNSIKSGGTAVAMSNGVLRASSAAAGNTIEVLTYNGASSAITLTATSQTKFLVGTTTIAWDTINGSVLPSVTGVAGARGIEFYDIDKNGKLDRATIFFDSYVKDTGGATPTTAFSVGGGTYTVSAVSQAGSAIFDAGGYGIKNAGPFGVTLTIAEDQGFNTGAKPQVTYNSSVGYLKDLYGNVVPNITTSQPNAIEVDKANPILLSYKTVDNGVAGGVADNGEVDGVEMVFSEPLATFTIGTTKTATGADIGDFAFALADRYQVAGGSATATGDPIGISLDIAGTYVAGSGNTYTLALVEKGATNTGILPVILHNEFDAGGKYAKDAANNLLITDFTTNAPDTAKDIAIKDGVSPVVTSVTTADTGTPDGRIDQVTVIFSETMNAVDSYTFTGVTFVSSVTAFGSGAGGNGTYATTAGQVGPGSLTDDTIVYTLTPSTAVYDTEARPTFYYNPSTAGANLKDSNGFALAQYANGTAGTRTVATDDIHDGAAPVIVNIDTGDDVTGPTVGGAYGFLSATGTPGADGRLDNVSITFSEKIGVTSKSAGFADLKSLVQGFTITDVTTAAATKIDNDTATNGTKPSIAHVSTGDTNSVLKFYHQEVAVGGAGTVNGGDTGYKTKVAYTKGAADIIADINDVQMVTRDYTDTKTTDKAKPFVMTIETGDLDGKAKPSDPTYEDNGNGDGFIDNFVFYFSENVKMATASDLTGFSADTSAGAPNAILFTEPGTGADFSAAGTYPADATAPTIDTSDNNVAANKVVFYAVSSRNVSPDTGGTPTIDYAKNATNPIKDTATVANEMASFSNKATTDKAKPVMVQAIGVVGKSEILVTFSESVTDKTDATALAIAANTSNLFFGLYNNTTATATGGGDSATAIGTTAIASIGGSTSKFKVYTNAALTIDDVSCDYLYLNSTQDVEDAASNEAESDSDGLISAIAPIVSIRIPINDIIPPHLTDAKTIDRDNDGWIDHILLTFNEDINDMSITGVADTNADDFPDVPIVATTNWGIGSYTGVAFNFFDDASTADGKANDNALVSVVGGTYNGYYVYPGNKTNDNQLLLMVTEQSGGANAFSGIGDTNATPALTFEAGITLADFRTNVFEPTPASNAICEQSYNVTTARDAAGPVLMSGALVSETEMQLKLSEKIVGTALGTNGTDQFANLFNLYVGTNQNTNWSTYVKDFAQLDAGYLQVIWTQVWEITAGNTAKAQFNVGGIARIKDFADTEQAWDSTARAVNTAVAPGTTWVAVTPYAGGGSGGSTTVEAPTNVLLTSIDPDNGHWFKASFTLSTTADVTDYQFYLQNDADPNNIIWEYFGFVQAGYANPDGKMVCYVASPINGTGLTIGIAARKGGTVSSVASKVAIDEIPVATMVTGLEKTAAGEISALATATVDIIDEVAFSPMTVYAAADLADSDNGIVVSWTPMEDHGQVGEWMYAGMGTFNIYGVEKYNVYRKSGDTFDLVGSVASGASQFIDTTATAGSTVYQYKIEMVDGNPAHTLTTNVRSALAQNGLAGDFDANGLIGASDFSIFAANYGKTNAADPSAYVWAYDLNADGSVAAADFSIFAAAYGSTLKAAKAAIAEMPEAQLPIAVTASVDEATSTYFVNVNIEKSTDLKGFEFFLTYDPTAVDFIENSITGLVGLNMTQVEDGVIRVSDWFVGEEFSGAVTLGFRSLGFNSTIDFGIGAATVDLTGNGKLAAVTDITEATVKALPTVYSLSQNYPNPFNPTTTIDYSIPRSGNVELVIFNMAGQKVRTLVSGRQDAAFYKVVWDGRNEMGESVASGLYFYSLKTAGFSKIEKMTLVK